MKVNTKYIISLLTIISVIAIIIFLVIDTSFSNYSYILSRRIPKILAMILSGSSIAIASVLFQNITNNFILTPSVLGLDSIFIFIQTLLVFLFTSSSVLISNRILNFVITIFFMILSIMMLYKFMFKNNNMKILHLVLVGFVIGTLFGSLSETMQLMIDPNEFLSVQNSIFASFNNINTTSLFICIVLFIIVLIFIIDDFKYLDILSLGKSHAINLGIDHPKITKRYLTVIAVLVSISTVLTGPITFLGLLVVNIGRQISNTYKQSHLLAISCFISFICLIGGQLLVEQIFGFEISISIIINFIGGIYFLYLLQRESKI